MMIDLDAPMDEFPCYCYMLRTATTGRVKVGIAKDLAHRWVAYRVHCPERLLLIFLCKVQSRKMAEKWEQSVLAKYEKYILWGEWIGNYDEISRELTSPTKMCGLNRETAPGIRTFPVDIMPI